MDKAKKKEKRTTTQNNDKIAREKIKMLIASIAKAIQ